MWSWRWNSGTLHITHSDRGIPQTKTANVNERTGGPVPTREDRGVRRNGPRRRAARLRALSSEPIGARNGPRELALQAAPARRLAELKLRWCRKTLRFSKIFLLTLGMTQLHVSGRSDDATKSVRSFRKQKFQATIRDHQPPSFQPRIFRSLHRPTMDNFGASQNGPPGATNAGQGQGTTGTTTFGGKGGATRTSGAMKRPVSNSGTRHARRDHHVPDKSTDVRAQLSCFQNMRRMAAIPEPRTTVVFLATVASR